MVVEFTFDPIDLRPDNELLAFKQTKQMIVLEQLSLGLISDDEACLQLTGSLAPPGMKPLSGTMFKQPNAQVSTSNPTNSGSTLNQNLAPTTPTTGRGQNRKAESNHNVEA